MLYALYLINNVLHWWLDDAHVGSMEQGFLSPWRDAHGVICGYLLFFLWHLQCICILILDYGRKASLVWGFGRVSEKLRFSKGWWWLIFILYEDTSLVGIISLPWWLLIFTTYAFISIVGHIPWLIVGWHITYV